MSRISAVANFWKLERVPEPEEMDEAEEVASYSSAAAERHLEAIDDTFVEHLSKLLPAGMATASPSLGLDVGTGPAQIPIKLLVRIPKLRIIGLDRSVNMLACARQNAARRGVSNRLFLLRSDGHRLPFPDGTFSMALCNSVLHHAREPVRLLQEIFRVVSPSAVVLIRDLRRPARPLLQWHLWRHGRHYNGLMRQLFDTSVRSAYTQEELEAFLKQAHASQQGQPATVFRYRGAHVGIERSARR